MKAFFAAKKLRRLFACCASALAFAALALSGCANEKGEGIVVLLYVPGVVAGSPTYEMMAEGAEAFARSREGVEIRVYEAGFNQATWEEQLMGMVAGGEFDLVLTTNPALPEIVANVARHFPDQKFVVTDAYHQGDPRILTYMFNQYEQALFLGYLAGLITTSDMPHANSSRRIGFIASQEFPMLTRHMAPGFIQGARLVDPAIELDFRVIGNWFDAGATAELAQAMINSGVDVFTAIAGGAAQGLFHVMRERGAYGVFFNDSEYHQAPGLVLGSGIMRMRELTEEVLAAFVEGSAAFGTARIVGLAEGYVDFDFDDPLFRAHVPVDIAQALRAFIEDLRSGRASFPVPPL